MNDGEYYVSAENLAEDVQVGDIVMVIHRFYFKFSSSLKKCNAEVNPFRTLSLVDDSPEIFTNVCNKGRTCSCDGKLYLAVSET